MGITSFPNGVSSFGMPVLPVIGTGVTTGNAFFVNNSTGSDAGAANGSISTPFKTIDYAIGRCTANNGDVIYVMVGHTETISVAGGITADVAGVSIIGLGTGTNRPIITFSATASTFLVSAANVYVCNLQMQNAIDSLVSGVSITGAGCTLCQCSFSSPTSTNDALMWVLTTAAADDLTITGCDFRQNHAGPTECIRLVGADRAKIIGNFITGSYSTAAINGITTASLEILIAYNTLMNSVTDALLIALVAACTGEIIYNNGSVVSTAGITAANICSAANCQLAQNYVSDAVGETGKLLGTVSA